eukprot:4557490-Prymnesium_polylepis.1
MGGGTVLRMGALKDPLRLAEKGAEPEYASRFGDGVPAEACVPDVLRARLVFTKPEAFVKTAAALQGGFRLSAHGAALRLELVAGRNRFMARDPSHFRRLVLEMRLHVTAAAGGRYRCLCEVELHHLLILAHHEGSDAAAHYAAFGAHLRGNYEGTLCADLDFVLERRMAVFEEVNKASSRPQPHAHALLNHTPRPG